MSIKDFGNRSLTMNPEGIIWLGEKNTSKFINVSAFFEKEIGRL